MIDQFCYDVCAAAIAEAERRQVPRWIPGEELDTGGRQVGSLSSSCWVTLGTGEYFVRWRRELLDFVVNEAVAFEDRALWYARQESVLEKVFGEFFAGADNAPVLVWVSPLWPLPPPALPGKQQLKLRDVPHSPQLLGVAKDVHQFAFTYQTGKSVGIDLDKLLMFYPRDRDREPGLHLLIRHKEGVDPQGNTPVQFRESALCLASALEDTWWLKRAYVPVLSGLRLDQPKSVDLVPLPGKLQGWLRIRNVIAFRLHSWETNADPWVEQLAVTFHPDTALVTNITASEGKRFSHALQTYPLFRTCLDQWFNAGHGTSGGHRLRTAGPEPRLKVWGGIAMPRLSSSGEHRGEGALDVPSSLWHPRIADRIIGLNPREGALPQNEVPHETRPSQPGPSVVNPVMERLEGEYARIAEGSQARHEGRGMLTNQLYLLEEIRAHIKDAITEEIHRERAALHDRMERLERQMDALVPDIGAKLATLECTGLRTTELQDAVQAVGRLVQSLAEETRRNRQELDVFATQLQVALPQQVSSILAPHFVEFKEETHRFIAHTVGEALAGNGVPSPTAGTRNGSSQLSGLPALEGKAAEVFEQLKTLSGNDAGARQQAQALINTFVGKPVTRQFTLHLQHFLREHSWRITCIKPGCRKAAAVIWQQNSECIQGGSLRCTHLAESGKSTTHGSMSVFREVSLLPYSDRRIK